MLISQRAIDNYLSRELDEWDWVKELSSNEIGEILESIEASDYAFDVLLRHQKEMLILGVSVGEMLFLADTGIGKSLAALSVTDNLITTGKAKCAFVFVPNVLLVDQWYAQVQKFVPHLKARPLYGTVKERLTEVYETHEDTDIFITTYAFLINAFKKWVVTKKKVRKSVIDPIKIDEFASLFDIVIYDECDALKSWKSLTYQICNRISNKVKYRYGLTATIIGSDSQDMWTQFYCIDRGKTFGTTLGLFRAAFFREKIKHIKGRKIYDYVLNKKRKPLLHKMMKNRSIRHRDIECWDMPEQIPYDVPLPMPKEYRSYYADAIEKVIESRGDVAKQENAFIRMREITSGYTSYYTRNEETGEKEEKKFIIFKENPKLDEMVQLIHSLPNDRKVIVFHEYTKTGQLITERLKKEKINHVWIYGKTKDKVGTLNKFKTSKTINVMVANNATGAKGLDLPMANYIISFETTPSPRIYTQMIGRIRRPDQKHKMFIYHFMMDSSIDHKIIGFIDNGLDLYQTLINGELSNEEIRNVCKAKRKD